ncbi:hypothetical protein COURTHOUSE_184 [Mycobacterium phage Courthouse]|uniref:Uncharacterized protein n=3 Tax=Omegavirus TaxID=1623292 RepID=G8I5P0_9CAUD|nr:hypothetical protein CM09_gp239 [Mycobacterium phage Courthouse]YP_009213406.1 hypothetical protein AVV70_gp248 [Mycobacterium phage MiaZeal]AER48034.1 hypothetical protein COURTHOUSE_184 [Mycobacterium phage Courthouse]AIY32543.1 hypothetical protein PBI_MIAZEAL_190 [Mycobacterium phage MiaZeal]ATS93024.1 hypothetical protein SEA_SUPERPHIKIMAN_185 [Mycobacterium phage Superphikiman]
MADYFTRGGRGPFASYSEAAEAGAPLLDLSTISEDGSEVIRLLADDPVLFAIFELGRRLGEEGL